MNFERTFQQPAFILHSKPYRENSRILDIFTRDYGRVAALAKAATHNQTSALLQPFVALTISYVGRSGLKTLSHVEIAVACPPLSGVALYSGFYLNELVQHFLHVHDPYPEVFSIYAQSVSALALTSDVATVLRKFELALLELTGYGLDLTCDALTQQPVDVVGQYSFRRNLGLVKDKAGVISGATLLALHNRDFSAPRTQKEAKLLFRAVIADCLQGKPLKSREVMRQIWAKDTSAG